MMFSWPSQESAASYTIDEAVVRVSGRKMARLLTGIVEQAGADRIHVIAHSMGNRALIEALETFVAGRDPAQPARVFDQVVFTAPDVDRDYFIDVVEDIKQVASRVTLYASENDLALQTSAALHGAPRAGLAGESIVTVAGLDTIDMSAVEADILGHSYFAASDGPIYDLFRLLWKGDPPEQRCGMNLETQDKTGFWLFDVDTCRGSDVLEAGLLIKRFGRRAREEVQRHLGALKDDADVASREEWSRILDQIDNLLKSDDG
jgi:pimeloyl-ACP methyl ester carboxylesterase